MNKILAIEPTLLDEKLKGTQLFAATNPASLPWKKGVVRIKAADVLQPVEVGKLVMYAKRGIAAPAVNLDGKDLDLVVEQAILVELDEDPILRN